MVLLFTNITSMVSKDDRGCHTNHVRTPWVSLSQVAVQGRRNVDFEQEEVAEDMVKSLRRRVRLGDPLLCRTYTHP
jgi:hypothetical protein